MSAEQPGWWERFCFKVGLCWDVPTPPAPVAAAPVQPAPDAGEGVALTLGGKIDRCLDGLAQVAFFQGWDEIDPQDRARLRSVIADRLRVEPHLAVVVEVPAQSRMVVPSELHFVEVGDGDFEGMVSRAVSDRRSVFDSDFFRIDVDPPAGPTVRSFAPEGKSVPPRALLPFTVKKEGGGGAPPPVRKR